LPSTLTYSGVCALVTGKLPQAGRGERTTGIGADDAGSRFRRGIDYLLHRIGWTRKDEFELGHFGAHPKRGDIRKPEQFGQRVVDSALRRVPVRMGGDEARALAKEFDDCTAIVASSIDRSERAEDQRVVGQKQVGVQVGGVLDGAKRAVKSHNSGRDPLIEVADLQSDPVGSECIPLGSNLLKRGKDIADGRHGAILADVGLKIRKGAKLPPTYMARALSES